MALPTYLDFVADVSEEEIIKVYISVKYSKKQPRQTNVLCPYCKSNKTLKVKSKTRERKEIFKCYSDKCKNKVTFSIFRDTILEKTRIDLTKWFYLIYLLHYEHEVDEDEEDDDDLKLTIRSIAEEIDLHRNTTYRMIKKVKSLKSSSFLFAVIDNLPLFN